jgi:hypothetical protein
MRLSALLFLLVFWMATIAQPVNIRGKNWILVSIQDDSLKKVFEYDKSQALLYFSDSTFVVSGKELHYGPCSFAKDTNLITIPSHEQNEWTSKSKDSYFAKYFSDLSYTLTVNMLELRNKRGVTFRFLASK